MNTGSIYLIRNKVNNKIYVGQTIQSVEDRFKQHLRLLKTNENQAISKAIKKYGKENFSYEILKSDILESDLDEEEIFFITFYNSMKNGYNLCPGGNQWRKQPKYTELNISEIIEWYTVQKMSSRLIGNKLGIPHWRVLQILKEKNLARPKNYNLPNRSSKLTEEILKDLLAQNLNLTEMAKKLNVNTTTVSRAFKRFNLKRI